MSGIDNNFVNKYIQFKRDGLSQEELQTLKRDAASGPIDTNAAKALTREIIRDGQVDQFEQQVLQTIGQSANDSSQVQRYVSAIDPTNSQIASLIRTGFQNRVTQPTLNVANMSTQDKLVESLKRSMKYVGPELRARLESMLTPQNLAILGAGLAAYAASHAAGVGFIADGALAIAGAVTLGRDAIDVMKNLYGFAAGAVSARSERELEASAQNLARGLATVVTDLPAIIGMRNVRVGSGTAGVRIPTGGGGMALAGAGGRVLNTATVVTVTYPVIRLTAAQSAAIGSTVMMAAANGNGGGGGSSIPPEYNNVPSKIRGPNGTVDTSKFTQRMRGGDMVDPKTGYRLSPERARNSGAGGHGGSHWKLLDPQGNRVGTIAADGRFLRG